MVRVDVVSSLLSGVVISVDSSEIIQSSDEGTIFPYGGVRITVRVMYEFTRGSA